MDKTARLKKFQIRLRQLGIDSAILIHSRDVFYYCGTAQPCILVVTPDDYYLIVQFLVARTKIQVKQKS